MPLRPNIPPVSTLVILVLTFVACPAMGQQASDTLVMASETVRSEFEPQDSADLRLAIEALRAEVGLLRSELETAQTNRAAAIPDTAGFPGSSNLQEARTRLRGLIWNVVQALLVIAVIFYVIRAISWLLEVLAERDATRRLLFKRLIPISRVLLWLFAAYVITDIVFEVTQQQLFAASAAVGVAIGFASQDILKNIFGGIIIILDKPFQVGDKIRVGGTYGEVVSIGLRATRIETPDDNLVSVPNAQVVDGQVSNANAGNLDCQVVTDLYLPGWVDVMKAKKICYEAAANSQYVYLDKPIVVNVVDEFRETFLTHIKVKAYVIDTRFEFRLASDVTETAKMQFMREGMLSPMVDLNTVTQSHLTEMIDENEDRRGD